MVFPDLGYKKYDQNKKAAANHRNGKNVKELRADGN
jgi:hypothetical protein